MADLPSAINNANLAQDYEFNLALNSLKSNTGAFVSYTDSQKNALKASILDAKDDAFNKVFVDGNTSAYNFSNTLHYYRKNAELLDTNKKLADNSKSDLDKVVFNDDLAKRSFELNEWAVENKRDTLFIYQTGFISLGAIIVLTLLKRFGLLPGGVFWYIMIAIVIIFALTVIYRGVYTEIARDKFYWNKRKFGSINAPIPASPVCPTASDNEAFTDMFASV